MYPDALNFIMTQLLNDADVVEGVKKEMYSTASRSFLFIHSRPDRIAAHVGIVKTFAKYLEGTVQSCKIASHVHGVLTEAIHDYYMGMA